MVTRITTGGISPVAYGPLKPVVWGYNAEVEKLYRYDPPKARQVLEEASWKLGAGGVRVKNEQACKMVCAVKSDPVTVSMLTAIQGMLKAVGIDLTSSVDAAYANIGTRKNVHLIQADIFAMPFREGTFDLAYSIGVLHHTPDPRAAFDRVALTVKKGGGLAVYLYSRYGLAHHFSDLLRSVTTRLPLRLMFAGSALAIPLYYLYRLPGLGPLFQLLCPISLHPNWRWRWLDTFDWYTPRYQWKFFYPEVFRWFRANGFHEIEVFDDPIRMRGIKTE